MSERTERLCDTLVLIGAALVCAIPWGAFACFIASPLIGGIVYVLATIGIWRAITIHGAQ